MRIHYLQHVSFEGLGSIEKILVEGGHEITFTRLYDNESLPLLSSFDCLIVMGGPMGIYDEEELPWLKDEKEFIKNAITAKKIVLGICLGAQLIAETLGAKVYKGQYKEIGWHNISTNPKLNDTILKDIFPAKFMAFHWHCDTFDIPNGAIPIGSSLACQNQGFIYADHVIALQFHLETTLESATALLTSCASDIDESKYVQNPSEITSLDYCFGDINQIMIKLIKTAIAN